MLSRLMIGFLLAATAHAGQHLVWQIEGDDDPLLGTDPTLEFSGENGADDGPPGSTTTNADGSFQRPD